MALVNGSLALVVSIAVNTYESMKRQLEPTFVDLRKKEAFEREMEIAREVQQQLFPKSVPRVRGLEIAGICLPAAGVGGDYFDFLPPPDERIGMVIADVSGKGISAALLMASLQASVRSAGPGGPPCEINRRLNEILHNSTSASRYATLFLATLRPAGPHLHYSNAGHHPPISLGPHARQRLSQGGSARVSCPARSRRRPPQARPGRSGGAVHRRCGRGAQPRGEEFGDKRLHASCTPASRHADLTTSWPR